MDSKQHWEHIYRTKKLEEVSWYQAVPETSLDFINGFGLEKRARIIDVGGGDSFLAEFLWRQGYENISVLDISEVAVERARKRMGESAERINWINADASNFHPQETFDVWHDRAAFHFLTEKEQIENYLRTIEKNIRPGGYVILGTFSKNGPRRCSGITIKQYSTAELCELFGRDFQVLNCRNVSHQTPSGSIQEFSFCSFKKNGG